MVFWGRSRRTMVCTATGAALWFRATPRRCSGPAGERVRRNRRQGGMEKLTDKPIGSVIEEEVDSEGITLRWWPPAAGFIHYAVAAGYALVLSIWVAGCFAAGAAILFQPVGFFSCGTMVVLCVLTYAGACLAHALWVLLAPDRPASVRLEGEWLRYDPGRSKVSAFRRLFEKRSPKGDPT